ncbi:MAG: DNA mismatch repair endonuclease MutL [Fimbriimonadaceae bacterium]|nr:DNA mismatch repair endonuclease MutL [Fimbriimonadaceae bacterium]
MVKDQTPRKIQSLDAHTVNQIAAGEVIERPASVVKELVENSLDAGARVIEVDLEQAGRGRIRVADDGDGMDEDSLRLAVERHATSKISRAADLWSVRTMGFRGEALPSIASVSRMTLSSSPVHGARFALRLVGGQFEPAAGEAGPKGTTVTVEDLFFNTPARLKFLRTDATELNACMEVVARHAMARPDVAFTVRHGQSVLLTTSGTDRLTSAIADVWGREVARSLVPVELYEPGLRVSGLVSPPHFTKAARSHQWLFVNGRPIRSKGLTAAIDQAYRSLTPDRRFPVVVLTLDVDPSTVDVNVSPTKSEVKFRDESAAFRIVRRAVLDGLMQHGMVPRVEDVEAANQAMQNAGYLGQGRNLGSHGGNGSGSVAADGNWSNGMVNEAAPPIFGTAPFSLLMGAQRPLGDTPTLDGLSRFSGLGGPGNLNRDAGDLDLDGTPTALPDLLDGFRLLGQSDSTFIVGENSQGLILIDQHVAHERILYERLRDAQTEAGVPRQPLMEPHTIHLGRGAAALVRERNDELFAAGYVIEPFGAESVLVREVPALWRGGSPVTALKDALEEMAGAAAQGGSGFVGSGCLGVGTLDVFAMAACKMAVKAGDKLADAEMMRLIEDLAKTENPYFCPHGRPITIVWPIGEIRRRFKR